MKNKILFVYAFFIISIFGILSLLIDTPMITSFESAGQSFNKNSGIYGDVVNDDDYDSEEDGNPLDGIGPTNEEIEKFFRKYFPIGCGLVILVLIVVVISQQSRIKEIETPKTIKIDEKKPLSDDKMEKIIPDFNKEKLIEQIFYIFSNIKKSYTDFDTYGLKNNLTDSLYLKYYDDLKKLYDENKTHIIRDVAYRGSAFKNIRKSNDIIILTMEMKVSYYDYIENNGRLVDGNRNKKVVAYYELEFITDISDYVSICPHCGAKAEDNLAHVCEYCNQKIPDTEMKWLLNKENILVRNYNDNI